MIKMLKKNQISGGIIQYAMAITTGVANFFALKFLQHSTPTPDLYSQLSTLLLSFTTFQLLTDLGTQTEFLRTYASADERQRSVLLHILLQSRLALGLAVLGVALIYAIAVGFSQDMLLAFLVYQLAFVPFAFMSVADSLFIAERKYTKAVVSRAARLLAVALFLVASWKSESSVLVTSAALSTSAFFLFAVFTWHNVLKGKLNNPEHWPLLSGKWWNGAENTGHSFITGSFTAAVFVLLISLQSFVAQGFMVHTIGETALSHFNTSLAISTPAILAMQTLVQLQSPAIAHWTSAPNDLVRRELFRFTARLAAISILMLLGLWVCQALGWVVWFFPMSNNEVFQLSLLVISAQALLNFNVPVLVLCQYRKLGTKLFWMLLVAIGLSWVAQFAFSSVWPEAVLLLALLLFAGIAGAGGLYLLGLHRTNQT